MPLLNLVEENDRIRRATNLFGEEAALVGTYKTGA